MKPLILIYSCLIILLTACDKRSDMYTTYNTTPIIEIRKEGTTLFQTMLYDSVKSSTTEYNIEYRILDEETLTAKGNKYGELGGDKFMMDGKFARYTIDGSIIGNRFIELSVTDSYGKEGKAKATFYVFDNLPPVALFTAFKLGVFDPLEYKIDAGLSYDRDAKYGGKIIEYEFIINTTYIVNTPFNNINYIFPSTGNYTISVRVKDDNNSWSVAKVIVLAVS